MTKTGKIILISALSLIMAALVLYGAQFGKTPAEKLAENPVAYADDAMQTATRLASAAETAWQNGTAKRITFSVDGSTASTSGVQIRENVVTVTSAGIYSVSGVMSEGQLTVDCDDTVVLILDGVEITNSSDAAINVFNAGHTLIYLPENSTNRLVSGMEQEITAAGENTDIESAFGAALYARDSLSFAGNGKLTVAGYINNAVATTDCLIVLGGELELYAVNNGLKGKDAVTVLDGRITIHSGRDGIKSSNDVDSDCGNIDIRGGEISIVSFGDGICAEKDLSVVDGVLTVSAGDIAAIDSVKSMQPFENPPDNTPPEMPGFDPDGKMNGNTPPEMPDFAPNGGGRMGTGNDNQTDPFGDMRGRRGMRGDFPDMPDREWSYGSEAADSMKGLKCGGNLMVAGGSIIVNSVDDCIHTNGSITVTGGVFQLRTGDDGFHADDTLTVSDGDITVSQSREGLEAHLIYLNGGNISVTSSDDGINANGGSSAMFGRMFVASGSEDSSLSMLKISGGTLCVNANGDGLDSNGDLIVEGGNIIVDGPADSGNGALDSGSENGGSIVCNGGTILAIGASGMAESFEGNSTQCSFIQSFSGQMPAGTQIMIADESGKLIFEHISAKVFNSIVFSSPELVLGSTYTITAGDQTGTITIESISNGRPSGFGMQGGFSGNFRK